MNATEARSLANRCNFRGPHDFHGHIDSIVHLAAARGQFRAHVPCLLSEREEMFGVAVHLGFTTERVEGGLIVGWM